ncbi:MAG TPA: TlpA disulfide reductase family protein [Pyrinomonadaceae bacterium]|jgi:thiol-disulfide isomerase/thioredoxin
MKFALCSLTLLLCLAPAAAQDEIKSHTSVGDAMPAFSFTTLDGRKASTEELKGKVVYVNFWATWCGPCLAEMPRMEREVWQRYKSAPDFFMVAIAREQTRAEIEPYMKENRLTFPVASDPAREVFRLFGNGGIPRSYVVGRDGRILYQSVGYDEGDFSKMKSVIAKALAQKGPEKKGQEASARVRTDSPAPRPRRPVSSKALPRSARARRAGAR